MKIYQGQNVPIKSWCNDPEQGALQQAQDLAALPFIFKHVCLMPDTHQGYGMPIGGVIACKDVVIPNAVGVDIGCGMCAIRFDIKHVKVSLGDLSKIVKAIKKSIPVGFEHRKQPLEWENKFSSTPIVNQNIDDSKYQLGTLGGGNHFIELQKGSDGFLWLMVHSGSRNFGYQIAKEYNKIAQNLCRKLDPSLPPSKGQGGLAYLPIKTQQAKDYITSMQTAMHFAKCNRDTMASQCKTIVKTVLHASAEETINIHHNYAALEKHFGRDVWVHRKGATSAQKGQLGLVPGSQGTPSYVVIGKGNPESFMSCSHGAGRIMSRKRAVRELDLSAEIKNLDSKGILHAIKRKKDLDEASSAYKDIDLVMQEQSDLVDIRTKLEPLAVIKG